MNAELIVAKAERLCLLYAAHRGRRTHTTTRETMRRLRRATAKVAALEAPRPEQEKDQ